MAGDAAADRHASHEGRAVAGRTRARQHDCWQRDTHTGFWAGAMASLNPVFHPSLVSLSCRLRTQCETAGPCVPELPGHARILPELCVDREARAALRCSLGAS
jgi:hypothetical protein